MNSITSGLAYKPKNHTSNYSTIIMIAFLLSTWAKFLKTLLNKTYSRHPNNTKFGLSYLLLIIMVNPIEANLNQIAYDCDNGSQSITTLDIEDIAACPPFNSTYTDGPKATIQVLQRTTNTLIQSYSCRARINREACRW